MIRWKILNEAHQFNPLDIGNFLRNFELTLKSSKGFNYLLDLFKGEGMRNMISHIQARLHIFCEALEMTNAEPTASSGKWKVSNTLVHIANEKDVEEEYDPDNWLEQPMFYLAYESQIDCLEGTDWNNLIKAYYERCEGDEIFYPDIESPGKLVFHYWPWVKDRYYYRLTISRVNNKKYNIFFEVVGAPEKFLKPLINQQSFSKIKSYLAQNPTPVQPKKIRVAKRNSQ